MSDEKRHRWAENPAATLGEAREWLMQHRDDGAYCPCCGQFAKVYRRKLSSSMAYALVLIDRFFRETPHGWLHVPSYLTENVPAKCGATFRGGDWAKLAYWGLLREQNRGDVHSIAGGPRAGYHRITDRGKLFVRGKIVVPKYVFVYDGEPMGFSEETTSIDDALGSRFDYQELMAASPPDPPRTLQEAGQLGLFSERSRMGMDPMPHDPGCTCGDCPSDEE